MNMYLCVCVGGGGCQCVCVASVCTYHQMLLLLCLTQNITMKKEYIQLTFTTVFIYPCMLLECYAAVRFVMSCDQDYDGVC